MSLDDIINEAGLLEHVENPSDEDFTRLAMMVKRLAEIMKIGAMSKDG
jgi:hypothetical protein